MNKTLIKNFAIDARVRLIQMAIDNAGLVGIAKDKIDSRCVKHLQGIEEIVSQHLQKIQTQKSKSRSGIPTARTVQSRQKVKGTPDGKSVCEQKGKDQPRNQEPER